MTQPPQRPPRRRKKKEPLVILLAALLVALVAWPFEKLFGRGRGRAGGESGGGRARLAALIAVGVVVALLVLFAAVAVVEAATEGGTIHDNVSVYGIGVGGLTVDQAAQKLARVAPRGGAVTLTLGRSPLDLERGRAARPPERRGGGPRRLRLHAHGQRPGARLDEPVAVVLRPLRAARGRVRPAAHQGAARHDLAGRRRQASAGSGDDQWRAAGGGAAKDGRAVDRAAVLRLLGAAVISGRHVTAALPVVTVTPDVSTADAQVAAATARAWLSGPLALTHGGHTWTIQRQELGQYLAFVPQNAKPRLRVTFDSPVTRGYFDFITQRSANRARTRPSHWPRAASA